jgi:hypothetical protein
MDTFPCYRTATFRGATIVRRTHGNLPRSLGFAGNGAALDEAGPGRSKIASGQAVPGSVSVQSQICRAHDIDRHLTTR